MERGTPLRPSWRNKLRAQPERRSRSHAVRLGRCIPMPVLGEIKTFLFRKSRFQVSCPANQARLALLADPALEDGLDEDQLVTANEVLDLVLGGARPEHFRRREVNVLQELCTIEHSCDLHLTSPSC